MMLAISIVMVVSVAAAGFFAALFFQGNKDKEKFETKADWLARELGDLRCDLARIEGSNADMVPLTKENIVDFLKREKTGAVEVLEDVNSILFDLNGERFLINYGRLPQQLVLRKGYGCGEDSNIHWDLLEQAAAVTEKSLVIVRVRVIPDDSYEFMTVSTTHTVAGLREDYDFLLSLIADAEEQLQNEYHKLVALAYPEECKAQGADAIQNMEDVAMEMAQHMGGQNKLS